MGVASATTTNDGDSFSIACFFNEHESSSHMVDL